MKWTKAKLDRLLEGLAEAYPEAECALVHADPFQLVVATILSAQCTDARVNHVTPALFLKYPDAASLASADQSELEEVIRSTGFFRNKARNLIGLGKALLADFGGVVPSDFKSLAALPGVGRKTANVVLANAFGVPSMAVDTHVFRVARRLGLSGGNSPDAVEQDLTRLFDPMWWISLHHWLIWHGRKVCDARKPLCSVCPVRGLCRVGMGQTVDPHSGRVLSI